MLDKKHIVNVPDGAIVKSDKTVLWTIEKRYIKEKKYNHDVRKQIGKLIDGSRDKMYPNDNFKEIFPDDYNAAAGPAPKPSFQSIGLYAVLKAASEELPLYECLYQAFGKQDADLIMDYAMYSIANETMVSQHFEADMASSALFSEKLRSDSFLSDFFHNNLGQEKIDLFLELWAPAIVKAKKINAIYANVDGSNIDCACSNSELNEKGHAKSKSDNKIIGLMYSVAPDGTPISYIQYRGSVVDSVAMDWMIRFSKSLGLDIQGFCIDRGFCSKDTADGIKKSGHEFVMMLTDNVKAYTDSVEEVGDALKMNVEKWLPEHELFGCTMKKPLFQKDTEDSFIHIFYDCEKGSASSVCLLRKVKKAIGHAWADIGKGKTPSIPADVREYVGLRQGRGPKTVVWYPEKLQKAVDGKGFFGLGTSKEMGADEARSIYAARDSSEKQFMAMKSEIGLDRYRVGSDRSIRGKQFVAFVAGILRNEIHIACLNMLSERPNPAKYSTAAVIKELQKIQIKRLPGDVYALVMNLSLKEKYMLKHLGLREKDIQEIAVCQNKRINGII